MASFRKISRKKPFYIYLTIILNRTVFLPDLTEIIVLPFFLAVMTPLEFTVAVFLSDEEYVIFCLLVTGVTVVFKYSFPLFFRATVLETFLFVFTSTI